MEAFQQRLGVRRYLHPWNREETRNYVRLILRNYINYARIYGDEPVKIASLVKMPELIPGREVSERSDTDATSAPRSPATSPQV